MKARTVLASLAVVGALLVASCSSAGPVPGASGQGACLNAAAGYCDYAFDLSIVCFQGVAMSGQACPSANLIGCCHQDNTNLLIDCYYTNYSNTMGLGSIEGADNTPALCSSLQGTWSGSFPTALVGANGGK